MGLRLKTLDRALQRQLAGVGQSALHAVEKGLFGLTQRGDAQTANEQRPHRLSVHEERRALGQLFCR